MAKDAYGDEVVTDDQPTPPTGSSPPASPAGGAYDVTPTSKKIPPIDDVVAALDNDPTFTALPYGAQERVRVELRYQFSNLPPTNAKALADRFLSTGAISDYGRGIIFGQNGLLKDLNDKQAAADFKDAKTRFDSSFDDMVTLPLQAAIKQAMADGRITAGADLTLLNQDYSRAQAWSDFHRGYSQLYEEPWARGFQSATGPRSTGMIMDHFFRTYADTQAALAGVDLPQTANIEAVKATLRAAVQPTLARIGQQQVAGELFDRAVKASQLKLSKLVGNPNLSDADREALTGVQYDLGTHAPALREQYRTTGGMPPEDFLNVNFLDSALGSATLAGDDTHAAYVKGDPVKTLGNIDIIAKAKAAKDLTANAAELVSTIRDPTVAAQFTPDKLAKYAAQGPTGLVKLRTDINNATNAAKDLTDNAAEIASRITDPTVAAQFSPDKLAGYAALGPTGLVKLRTDINNATSKQEQAKKDAATLELAGKTTATERVAQAKFQTRAGLWLDQQVKAGTIDASTRAKYDARTLEGLRAQNAEDPFQALQDQLIPAAEAQKQNQWKARSAATIAGSKLAPEIAGRYGTPEAIAKFEADATAQGTTPDALLDRALGHEATLATERTTMADAQKAKAGWMAGASTALQGAVHPSLFHDLLGHFDLGSMYDTEVAQGRHPSTAFQAKLAPWEAEKRRGVRSPNDLYFQTQRMGLAMGSQTDLTQEQLDRYDAEGNRPLPNSFTGIPISSGRSEPNRPPVQAGAA